MFGLGRKALNATPLPEVAIPHLRWLVQESKLTAHMGILEKCQVVFVQKIDGPGIIKFDTYIGKCSELHCTGLGKALLAFQPEEIVQSVLSNYAFDRFTKRTISSHAAFVAELARVRQNGYAIDDEEEELGIRCIAAPVLSSGAPVAAVSVTGTTTQIRIEDIEACRTCEARGWQNCHSRWRYYPLNSGHCSILCVALFCSTTPLPKLLEFPARAAILDFSSNALNTTAK